MSTHHSTAVEQVGRLYVSHHGWLVGWLRGKLGSDCDATDIAQDTFVRLLGRRVEQDLREPRSYLATIAQGLVVDFFRHRRLERAYLDTIATLPEEHIPSPETRAILLETLCRIDAMLDGMKPIVRRAFLMSQLEGLTYVEIAARLDVTKRTVGNYMTTALAHCYTLAA
ncbi:sigma-70 family RNA polymerase sigma factor [Herbaspirillum sp. alder98]|uniref:sigma-70 family RNA polymerase sigma factor n=1 Tax=Herbaspirillum sp. alder98 TaxID=2913096 RepID=UPI001CD8750B|nr:sigma-70 family RNA polymerase sigma factor [Herbaspirillum sp. alder98]MCA1323450.1 sigma-70 family RNA polymerase sigma factor [Herbaspirillum sp. alder98]